MSNRQQFVQVNDKQSRLKDVLFGVPQGSVLGPVIFSLYANDMQDCLNDGSTCFQYADDTTMLLHAPPKDLKDYVNRMNNTLQSIESWAADSNLLLNEAKTKQIVTTRQMSRVHDLGDYTPHLSLKNKIVDRVDRFRLLGTLLSQDIKWTLDTLENTQLNILKIGHRALYNNNWPEYLTL